MPFAREAFRHYWRDHADISQDDVVLEIAATSGVKIDGLADIMDGDIRRARLRTDTQDLIDRGSWRTPTFFIEDDLYFGQDRLPFLEARLNQAGS